MGEFFCAVIVRAGKNPPDSLPRRWRVPYAVGRAEILTVSNVN